MLIQVPVEIWYEEISFEVLGNLIDGEYICLPCIGDQFDMIWDEMNSAEFVEADD